MAEFISPKQLASELDVPISTTYRWNTEGTGPTIYRIGKHVRYRRDDVDAWLAGKADQQAADV